MSERIVVGVDGSPESRAALRWAYDEAGRRGATLEVVTVWSFPPMMGAAGMPFPAVDASVFEEAARAGRDEAMAELPDGKVEVERKLIEGAASWILLHEAKDAAMLVVGSRGLGGFRGLLLGSVSQQCVHHAECPVVVVRTPSPGD